MNDKNNKLEQTKKLNQQSQQNAQNMGSTNAMGSVNSTGYNSPDTQQARQQNAQMGNLGASFSNSTSINSLQQTKELNKKSQQNKK